LREGSGGEVTIREGRRHRNERFVIIRAQGYNKKSAEPIKPIRGKALTNQEGPEKAKQRHKSGPSYIDPRKDGPDGIESRSLGPKKDLYIRRTSSAFLELENPPSVTLLILLYTPCTRYLLTIYDPLIH
jgi:hypothetical protein